MKSRSTVFLFMAVVFLGTLAPVAAMAQEQTTWDDLQLVKSGRSQRVFLLPGANFQPYTKVMFDKTEVAFRKNWMRNYNQSTGSLSQRVSQGDIDRVSQEVSSS